MGVTSKAERIALRVVNDDKKRLAQAAIPQLKALFARLNAFKKWAGTLDGGPSPA